MSHIMSMPWDGQGSVLEECTERGVGVELQSDRRENIASEGLPGTQQMGDFPRL